MTRIQALGCLVYMFFTGVISLAAMAYVSGYWMLYRGFVDMAHSQSILIGFFQFSRATLGCGISIMVVACLVLLPLLYPLCKFFDKIDTEEIEKQTSS